MSFKLRFNLPARSNLSSIAGVVAAEQVSNPGFIVGEGGVTGPTGPLVDNPTFDNVFINGSLTGNNGFFNILTANNITGASINSISLNTNSISVNNISGVNGHFGTLSVENFSFNDLNVSDITADNITGTNISSDKINSYSGAFQKVHISSTGNQISFGTGTQITTFNTGQPPSDIFINFPIRDSFISVYEANTIYVDKLGSDSYGTREGPPFLTLSSALLSAQPGDTVVVSPGTYSENNITIPDSVVLIGVSPQSCIIETSVTDPMTAITMGDQSRFENFTVNLFSSTNDIVLTGILFPEDTSLTSKISNCSINVTNNTTDTATVYGVRSIALSSPDDEFQAICDTTITVNSSLAANGTVRAVYVVSGGLYTRDSNIVSIGGSGISSVGVETENSTSEFKCRNGLVKGTTQDILETGGTIKLSFTTTTDRDVIQETGDNSVTVNDGNIYATKSIICDSIQSSGTGYFTAGISTLNITGTNANFSSVNSNVISSLTGSFSNILCGSIVLVNENVQNINVVSLTGGSGSFQNLSINSLTGNSITCNSTTITNAVISNITGNFSSIQGITSSIITSNTGIFTNISVNSITGSYISVHNFTGGTGTFNGLSTNNISVSNITGNNAFFTRLTASSVTGSNANFTIGNFQTITTNSLISNSLVGSITGNSGTFNNMAVQNIIIGSSVATASTISNVNIESVTGNSGYFNNITVGDIDVSSSNITNSNITNLVFDNTTGTNMDIVHVNSRFVTIESVTGTSGSFDNFYIQNLQVDNSIVETIVVNSISGSSCIFDTATIQNISSSTGSITILTSSGIYTANITGSSGTFRDMSVSSYTGNDITTSVISLNNNLYTASFTPSTGMSGSYTMVLPPNIPDYPITFLTSDASGKLQWSRDLFPDENTKYVSNNPISGQYSTIEDAINACSSSIVPPSATNQFLIIVMAGTYVENLLSVPSYIRITGQNQESTIITPAGDHNVFNLSAFTTVNFLTINDCPQAGVYILDSDNFTLMHKVSINSCRIGAMIEASTVDSLVFFEYTDFNDCLEHEVVLADSAFNNYVSLENHFIQHTVTTNQESIIVGINGTLVYGSGSADGGSVGKCIVSQGSTSITTNSVNITNYVVGIESTGSNITDISSNATVMSGNTIDIDIGPTTTGYFFGILDRSKAMIDPSSYYIYGVDSNIITVAKKGGDFTSVSAAIASITSASVFNPYTISVGPGLFIEPRIILKPYVSIIGNSSASASIFICQNNEQDFIIGAPDVTVKNISMIGPTGDGYSTVLYNGSTGSVNPFILYSCVFRGGDRLFTQNSNSGTSSVLFTDILIPFSSSSDNDFVVTSTTGSYQSIFVFNSLFIANSPTVTNVLDISGVNTLGQLNNSRINGLTNSTGTGVNVYNGARVDVTNSRINNIYKAISVPNLGTGPNINISSSFIDSCPVAVDIDNPFTVGFIDGAIDHTKIFIDEDSDVSVQTTFNDGLTISGNIFFGPEFNNLTNITDSLQYSTNLGKIDGGLLTTSNLTVTASSGYGYLSVGTPPDDNIRFVQWNSQTASLIPDSENYIYVDSSGIVNSSITLPNFLTNIRLGQIYATSSSALYNQDTSQEGIYSSMFNGRFLTDAIGPIVSTGLITTSPTGLYVNVTSGEYFYGSHKHNLPQSTGIQMNTFYRNGTGGYTNGFTGFVSAQWDDNSGTLQTVSDGDYVKHSLYVTDNGGTGSPVYLLVYGQQTFSAEAEAVEGPLPIEPSFITGDVFSISGIVVVKDGVLGDHITDLVDIRPTISFRSGSTTATSDHNSLSNLSVGDAHPQYVRTDGTRTMAGNFNMGANNIVNLTNVVSTAGTGMSTFFHASRHLPNGQDPLQTDVPVSIGTSNDQGIANSFSRSDHTHSHGNLLGGSLHSTVDQTTAGFMSVSDKIKLDSATGVSTPNSIVYRDNTGFIAVTSMSGTSAFINSITVKNITGSTGTFINVLVNNITGSISNFSTSTVNSITGNNSSFQNGNFTSITSGTGIFSDISSTSIVTDHGSFQLLTSSNFQSNTGSFSYIDTQYITCNTGGFNILNTNSISGSTATFTNLNTSSISASGFTGSTATLRTLTVTNNITGDSITTNTGIVKTSITGNLGTFQNIVILSGITGGSITNNSLRTQSITSISGSFTSINTNTLFATSTGTVGTLSITGTSNQITTGNGTKTTLNFPTAPSSSTLNFPVRTGSMRQEDTNVIRVDKSGSDTFGSRNGLPFLTVAAGIAVSQAGDVILLSPGIYSEDSLVLPANVTMASIGKSARLSSNVSSNKTILTMGENSRLEEVDVYITSDTSNITVIAVAFTGSSSATSKIRSCVINASNTTSDNATVYGIYCTCTGAISATNSTIRSSTIIASATNASFGSVRAGLISSGEIETRECNFSATSGQGAEAVGIETSSNTSKIYFRTSTALGTTDDYRQTLGDIDISYSQTDEQSIIRGNGSVLISAENGTIIADNHVVAKGNISATGGTGYFLNLSVNNISGSSSSFSSSIIGSIQSNTGNIQNLTVMNITGENQYMTNINVNSITGNGATFNSLNISSITGSSSTFINTNITNIITTNITGTSAHINNMVVVSFTGGIINSQSLNSTSISGSNGVFTSINTTNITGSSSTFVNSTVTNITGSSSTFSTSRATNFTGTNATITTLTATNLSGNNQTYSSGIITNLITTNFTGTNGFITNLGTNNITGVTATIASTTHTNLITTNFTGTNGFITNLGTNNITGVTVTIASATHTNLITTNFTGTNGFITNLGTNNITGVTATITDTTHTNLTTTNFTGTNAFVTNYTGSILSVEHINVDYIIGRTVTPSLAVNSGVTVTSSSIVGNDISGYITFTVSGGTNNGIMFTITFAKPRPVAPMAVILSPGSASAASVTGQTPFVAVASNTTTSWRIQQNTSKLANGTYSFYYLVV